MLIQNWNKIISYDMREKEKFKIGHKKSKEKDEFETLGMRT
jgi:hypothetical protein